METEDEVVAVTEDAAVDAVMVAHLVVARNVVALLVVEVEVTAVVGVVAVVVATSVDVEAKEEADSVVAVVGDAAGAVEAITEAARVLPMRRLYSIPHLIPRLRRTLVPVRRTSLLRTFKGRRAQDMSALYGQDMER